VPGPVPARASPNDSAGDYKDRERENRTAPLPAAHNRASKDPEPGTPDQEGRVIVGRRRYRKGLQPRLPRLSVTAGAPVRWSPTARFGRAPHPIGEENDRSMRKPDDRSMRRAAAGQVSAVPGDRKDENLHRGDGPENIGRIRRDGMTSAPLAGNSGYVFSMMRPSRGQVGR
jgi:hypothetical protein